MTCYEKRDMDTLKFAKSLLKFFKMKHFKMKLTCGTWEMTCCENRDMDTVKFAKSLLKFFKMKHFKMKLTCGTWEHKRWRWLRA